MKLKIIIHRFSEKWLLALLVIFSLGLPFNLSAKAKKISLSPISGNELGLTLRVDSEDLKPDLSKGSPRVRLYFKPENFLEKSGVFKTIGFEIYELNAGKKERISQINRTIGNPKKFHVSSFPLNHFSKASREVFIDVLNSENKLISTYKLELNAKNLNSQISSQEEDLANSNCDNSVFGKCQMEYILENLSFETYPKKNPSTEIMKSDSGAYKVKIGVPLIKNAELKKTTVVNNIENFNQNANGSLQEIDLSKLNGISLNPQTLKSDLENGLIEFDGNSLYYTSNGSRKTIAHTGQLGSGGSQTIIRNEILNNTIVQGAMDISPVSELPGHEDGRFFMTGSGALCMSINGNYEKIGGKPDAFCEEKNFTLDFTELEKITVDGTNDLFDVEIKGNELFVSSRYDDSFKYLGGSVSYFTRTSSSDPWVFQEKFGSTNLTNGGSLGTKLAFLESGELIATAGGDNESDGTAFFFTQNGSTGLWEEKQKITPLDTDSFNQFGQNLFIFNGNSLIIDAISDDEEGAYRAGAIYFFNQDPVTKLWSETDKIISPDYKDREAFGHSLDFDGVKTLFVGAPSHLSSDRNGQVYIFQFNSNTSNWDYKADLLPTDGTLGQAFGTKLSLTDDNQFLMVSARKFIVDGKANGAVYIFKQNGSILDWKFHQLITGTSFDEDARYGDRLLVDSQNNLYVSAIRQNFVGNESGIVYKYIFDPATENWNYHSHILGSQTNANDGFGMDIEKDGSDLYIISSTESISENTAGAIYKFGPGTQVIHPQVLSEGNVNIGIGVENPKASLHINGTMLIENGVKKAGAVLISDNEGYAKWSDGLMVQDSEIVLNKQRINHNNYLIHRSMMSLGFTSGGKWYKALTYKKGLYNHENSNIHVKIDYLASLENYSVDANIRVRSALTSNISSWNYKLSTNYKSNKLPRQPLKWQLVDDALGIWDLYYYSPDDYAEVSVEASFMRYSPTSELVLANGAEEVIDPDQGSAVGIEGSHFIQTNTFISLNSAPSSPELGQVFLYDGNGDGDGVLCVYTGPTNGWQATSVSVEACP